MFGYNAAKAYDPTKTRPGQLAPSPMRTETEQVSGAFPTLSVPSSPAPFSNSRGPPIEPPERERNTSFLGNMAWGSMSRTGSHTGSGMLRRPSLRSRSGNPSQSSSRTPQERGLDQLRLDDFAGPSQSQGRPVNGFPSPPAPLKPAGQVSVKRGNPKSENGGKGNKNTKRTEQDESHGGGCNEIENELGLIQTIKFSRVRVSPFRSCTATTSPLPPSEA